LRSPQSEIHALCLSESAHAGSPGLATLLALAEARAVVAQTLARGELDRFTRGGVHQGVVAFCPAFHYHSDVHALLQAAGNEPPLVVILDGVTDPQNLGALVRSTYVLGGHGVVLPMNHSAGVTAATAKAAAGATEVLPIAQVPNLVRALRDLKEREVQLLAAVAPGQGGQPAWDCDLSRPTAILLGSEGKGLRPQVRKSCDGRIEVPMQAGLHGASLNVSAAGAVLLYEALRQRRQPDALRRPAG
jgi:23S rRNA (guanosine2251-2'-O)-methyltransferase